MKKIVHLITGLNTGGAENMLYKLVSNSDSRRFSHVVISLMDKGVFGEKLEATKTLIKFFEKILKELEN